MFRAFQNFYPRHNSILCHHTTRLFRLDKLLSLRKFYTFYLCHITLLVKHVYVALEKRNILLFELDLSACFPFVSKERVGNHFFPPGLDLRTQESLLPQRQHSSPLKLYYIRRACFQRSNRKRRVMAWRFFGEQVTFSSTGCL